VPDDRSKNAGAVDVMNTMSSHRKYFAIYFTLVALTLLTCALSLVPQAGFHTTIGLIIAGIKGCLIAVFFMHILANGRLPWMTLLAGLLWFLILLGLTLADYLTRGLLSY
jgi:cytochrome c oxidase subunit 4